MDQSPGAQTLLRNIEEIEQRLQEPWRYSQQQVDMMVKARSEMIGQMAENDRAFGGESVADAMRREAHDRGGLSGVYDSHAGGMGSLGEGMTRDQVLDYTRAHFGDEAMANVEATFHEQALGAGGEGEADHG